MKLCTKLVLIMAFIIFLLPITFGDIKITSPKDGFYSYNSSSYNNQSGKSVHYFSPEINITNNLDDSNNHITYYELYDNDIFIGKYNSNDSKPTTLGISIPGIHNLKVNAYNSDNQIIANDSVKIHILIDYFDIFTAIDEDRPITVDFEVSQEDINLIGEDVEVFLNTIDNLEIIKEYIKIKVENKNTGEFSNHTIIRIKLIPKNKIEDLTIYEVIPKEVIESVNEIIFNDEVNIIDEDPLMAWNFEDVSEETEIIYHVEKDLSNSEIQQIKTIPIGEPKESFNLIYYMIPIAIIPFLGFFFIYFSRFKRE